jgi:hypothetical protein
LLSAFRVVAVIAPLRSAPRYFRRPLADALGTSLSLPQIRSKSARNLSPSLKRSLSSSVFAVGQSISEGPSVIDIAEDIALKHQ